MNVIPVFKNVGQIQPAFTDSLHDLIRVRMIATVRGRQKPIGTSNGKACNPHHPKAKEIIAEYVTGQSFTALRAKFCVSGAKARAILKDAGVPSRPYNSGHRRIDRNAIADMQAEGMSAPQIAARLGVPSSSINRIIREETPA